MTLVNVETGEVVAYCTPDEARSLTDEIRGAAERVWSLLVEAHDRRAWAALGYSSWRDYAMAEFGMSQSHAYRLLDQGRVVSAIEEATGSPMGELSERSARDIKPRLQAVTDTIKDRIAEEAVAEAPERVKEIVREVIAETRAEPNTRTRRTPLADEARTAGWELRKAVERIERIVGDDRFADNKEAVAAHLRDHLSYSIEVGRDLIERTNP